MTKNIKAKFSRVDIVNVLVLLVIAGLIWLTMPVDPVKIYGVTLNSTPYNYQPYQQVRVRILRDEPAGQKRVAVINLQQRIVGAPSLDAVKDLVKRAAQEAGTHGANAIFLRYAEPFINQQYPGLSAYVLQAYAYRLKK